MKKTRVLSLCSLLVGGGLAFPAVRQVRVTAERAAVYAEPSRRSTRIDIVQKGAVLNLFQQQKVKEIWYYVSYNSRRYGSRMSGFILDTAVEPVEEGGTSEKPVSPAPETKAEQKKPEPPPETVKPAATEVPSAPAKTESRPAPTPELKREAPRVVEYSEVIGLTPLPRAKRISIARRPAGLEDSPWSILQPPEPEQERPPAVISTPAPPVLKPGAVEKPAVPEKVGIASAPEVKKEEPKVVEYSVVAGLTPAPRPKRLSLPRRSPTLQDNPWAVLQPAVREQQAPAAKPKSPVTVAAPSITPAVRKPAPEIKPPAKEKPAAREPDKPRPAPDSTTATPQIRPPRPARAPKAARGPARLGVGLGFGPSFGGAGGSLQLYLSRSLALHAGLGIYPTTIVYSETDWVKNEMFWSAGLRFYPAPASEKLIPYIDAQYGGLRVEAAQVITGIYEYSYIYRREQKVLWGPSLLAGLEMRFGRLTLSGGLGGSYSTTEWEYLKSRFSFVFEAGLGMRL